LCRDCGHPHRQRIQCCERGQVGSDMSQQGERAVQRHAGFDMRVVMRIVDGVRRVCSVCSAGSLFNVRNLRNVRSVCRMRVIPIFSLMLRALCSCKGQTWSGHAARGGTGHQGKPALRQGARVRHVARRNEGAQQRQHDKQTQQRMDVRAGGSSNVMRPGHGAMILAIGKAGWRPASLH